MLQNDYVVVEIGVDTAENGPFKTGEGTNGTWHECCAFLSARVDGQCGFALLHELGYPADAAPAAKGKPSPGRLRLGEALRTVRSRTALPTE